MQFTLCWVSAPWDLSLTSDLLLLLVFLGFLKAGESGIE